MPTISLSLPSAGNVVTAALLAGDMTTLSNLLNAGLDGANWAPGKIFDPAKLLQAGADTRHVIGWNGSQWGPQLSPVQFFDSTLGADTASVDVQNIPQTHQGLLIVCYARSSFAGIVSNLFLRFNNDSGSNYDFQQLQGQAAAANAAEAFAQVGASLVPLPGSTATANAFSGAVISIPHYANTANNKIASAITAHKQAATTTNVSSLLRMCAWRSNSAINRITFLDAAGANIVAGSRISIYLMP